MNQSRLYLWPAIIVLAASSAVVRKLTMIGASAVETGAHNPISYCNVLFAGNLVALVFLFLAHRGDWTRGNLRRLSGREWSALTAVGVLSVAFAPSLLFTALAETSVTNVVLLGRIEPPLLLLLAAVFLGERSSSWSIAGSIIALAGVAATLLLQPMSGGMLMLGRGEWFALAGAACLAAGTIVSKAWLGNVPLGIFTVFRTAVGTIVFAGVVLALFPPDHFADVFSPLLWRWMLLYGAVIVAAGQLLWFTGVRASSTAEISMASSFTPVIAIAAAYLIVGETPNAPQFLGGAVILFGIFVGQVGIARAMKSAGTAATDAAEAYSESASPAARFDTGVGFKGI